MPSAQDVRIEKNKVKTSGQDCSRDELSWAGLSDLQKCRQLAKIERFDQFSFRHLLDCIRALLRQNQSADAIQLANHYFKILDSPPSDLSIEELSRAPELISTMAGLAPFISKTGERLCQALADPALNGFLHYHIATALAALSGNAALHEDFEMVETLGMVLELRLSSDPAAHKDCCGGALSRLLPVNLVERVIERALAERNDMAWQRRAALLLRFSGAPGLEKSFQYLETERNASRRIILMRLISRSGAGSLELVRKRLQHTEWYVVRNACLLLHEMCDPELCEQLGPVLHHLNDTVQETAVKLIIQSRGASRGQILAANLRYLRGAALEKAFQELALLKDPTVLPALEDFIYRHQYGDGIKLRLALRALIAIPCPRSAQLVSNIASDQVIDESIRKIALAASG